MSERSGDPYTSQVNPKYFLVTIPGNLAGVGVFVSLQHDNSTSGLGVHYADSHYFKFKTEKVKGTAG